MTTWGVSQLTLRKSSRSSSMKLRNEEEAVTSFTCWFVRSSVKKYTWFIRCYASGLFKFSCWCVRSSVTKYECVYSFVFRTKCLNTRVFWIHAKFRKNTPKNVGVSESFRFWRENSKCIFIIKVQILSEYFLHHEMHF